MERSATARMVAQALLHPYFGPHRHLRQVGMCWHVSTKIAVSLFEIHNLRRSGRYSPHQLKTQSIPRPISRACHPQSNATVLFREECQDVQSILGCSIFRSECLSEFTQAFSQDCAKLTTISTAASKICQRNRQ